MAVCIFVFEGTKTQVEQDMDHIFKLVKKYQGLRAGELILFLLVFNYFCILSNLHKNKLKVKKMGNGAIF